MGQLLLFVSRQAVRVSTPPTAAAAAVPLWCQTQQVAELYSILTLLTSRPSAYIQMSCCCCVCHTPIINLDVSRTWYTPNNFFQGYQVPGIVLLHEMYIYYVGITKPCCSIMPLQKRDPCLFPRIFSSEKRRKTDAAAVETGGVRPRTHVKQQTKSSATKIVGGHACARDACTYVHENSKNSKNCKNNKNNKKITRVCEFNISSKLR